MLSTLDWALIETWREAGRALEAVLRHDSAFDKHDASGSRGLLANAGQWLAWCARRARTTEQAANSIGMGTGTWIRFPFQRQRVRESGFESAASPVLQATPFPRHRRTKLNAPANPPQLKLLHLREIARTASTRPRTSNFES